MNNLDTYTFTYIAQYFNNDTKKVCVTVNKTFRNFIGKIKWDLGTEFNHQNKIIRLNQLCSKYDSTRLYNYLKKNDILDIHTIFITACFHNNINMLDLIDLRDVYASLYSGLVEACKNGHVNVVKLIVSCHLTGSDIGNAMIVACKHDHWDIVEILMDHKPYYFPDIFEHVCRSGNINLFNHIFDEILKSHMVKTCFYIVCKNGHLEIIKLLVPHCTQKNIMKGFSHAYKNNHMHVCDYFSSIGITNWNSYFINACKTNNIESLKSSLQNNISTLNTGFEYACANGCLDIVKLLINQVHNVNNGFQKACESNQYNVVDFLIDKQNVDIYWFGNVCYKNHIGIVKLLLERCSKNITTQSLNNGLFNACANNNIQMIDMLIFHGANNWNNGLSGACKNGNYELMMCMIKMGATTCSNCGKKSIEHTCEFNSVIRHFCL